MIIPLNYSKQASNFSSNQILVQDKKSQIIYYVPVYLRIKVQNINKIDLKELNGEINATMILTVYYGNLSNQIIQKISNNIILQFVITPSIKLQPSLSVKFKHEPQEQTFTYTIRKMLDVRLFGQVFLTPFQIINLELSISIKTISLKYKEKNVQIRFNFMDHPNHLHKISYSQDIKIGQYQLAPSRLMAQYSPQTISSYEKDFLKDIGIPLKQIKRKTIKQYQKYKSLHTQYEQLKKDNILKQQQSSQLRLDIPKQPENKEKNKEYKIINIQYAHFLIPLYRRPGVTILTVFFPLIILGIINLGIFFQDQRFGKRFLNLSALMIAYAKLTPTVRQTIPPGPTLTLVQFLVYLQSSTTLICLIQSIIDRNNDNVAAQFTDSWQTNPYLIICLVITVLIFTTITLLYTFHKFFWLKSYLNVRSSKEKTKFVRDQWRNTFADNYFKRSKNMVPLQSSNYQQKNQNQKKIIKVFDLQ